MVLILATVTPVLKVEVSWFLMISSSDTSISWTKLVGMVSSLENVDLVVSVSRLLLPVTEREDKVKSTLQLVYRIHHQWSL